MIFASLGTMNIAFNRMAKAVDEWAAITKKEVAGEQYRKRWN